MARNIFIVNATQVVISESHPGGILSVVSGYPKQYDSNLAPYNGNIILALNAAKAEYFDRLGTMYADTNAARIVKTVTLETADGGQVLKDSIGNFIEPEEAPEIEE